MYERQPNPIIQQYKADKESVYNTWFINNEERLKAFRSIRRGVMQVIEDIKTRKFPSDFKGSSLEFVLTCITEQKASMWRNRYLYHRLSVERLLPGPSSSKYGAHLSKTLPATSWGVSIPLNLLFSAALGIWLMFAPYAFGFQGRLGDSDHLIGALMVTFSVIAMAEVVRYVRFLNIAAGAWLITAPFLLHGSNTGALWNDVTIGVLLIALNIRKGKIKEHYGTYDPFIV